MQIQFNIPVTIGQNTYGKGQHDVPAEDVKGNWFFDALVKDGNAIILRDDTQSDVDMKAKSTGKKE